MAEQKPRKRAAKKTAAKKAASSGGEKVTVVIKVSSGSHKPGDRRSFDAATAEELVRNGHARRV